MQDAAPTSNSREPEERRNFHWRTVLYGFLLSRRRNLRRDSEGEAVFSDWHHPWLFFLSVGIMVFSCLDAFMTLLLLERGAYEANPIMASVMGHSTQLFAAVKLLLTGLGLLALVFLSRALFLNRMRTGLILTCVFSIYACLICYEFVYLMRTS